jgi:FdhE protein
MIDSTSKDLKEALFHLNKLKKERPALQGPADLFLELLPQLFEGESHDQPPSITSDRAQAKLADGLPLLRGEPVTVDPKAFLRRWLQTSAAVEQHRDPQAGKALANVIHHNRWDPKEIIAAVLDGSPRTVHERAEELGLDAELAGTAIRLSLFPSLANLQVQLTSLLQGEGKPSLWERGYCPICGSWPLLGEFRGLEQIRYLRCGFCAADWKVPHLLCPFCRNRDHRSLGYLNVEKDETKFRINTCDSCRSYVKMLSTLMPLSGPQLLAADVATMHLDLAAAQRGYGIVASSEQ